MTQTQAERWRATRERGIRSYVLKTGVLAWGLAMFLYLTLQSLRQPNPLTFIFLVDLPLCVFGGVLFGLGTWYATEWQYKRYLAKQTNDSAT